HPFLNCHELSDAANVITISIGIASKVAEDDSSPQDLIKLADGALYRAKKSGRDRCMIAEQEQVCEQMM
ncbi:GGDEF domain-containing protein, partial [Kaarinaea lacus]